MPYYPHGPNGCLPPDANPPPGDDAPDVPRFDLPSWGSPEEWFVAGIVAAFGLVLAGMVVSLVCFAWMGKL